MFGQYVSSLIYFQPCFQSYIILVFKTCKENPFEQNGYYNQYLLEQDTRNSHLLKNQLSVFSKKNIQNEYRGFTTVLLYSVFTPTNRTQHRGAKPFRRQGLQGMISLLGGIEQTLTSHAPLKTIRESLPSYSFDILSADKKNIFLQLPRYSLFFLIKRKRNKQKIISHYLMLYYAKFYGTIYVKQSLFFSEISRPLLAKNFLI